MLEISHAQVVESDFVDVLHVLVPILVLRPEHHGIKRAHVSFLGGHIV